MPRDALDSLLKTSSKDKWKRIGTKRRAGVLVPLFSVYSRHSVGIGDLGDLKTLIDWCGKTGNSILQLLPMNEVSFDTYCPYDALSSFALEPAYISLRAIPHAKKKSFARKINSLKKAFTADRPYVDYRIKEEKVRLLRDIYKEAGDINSRPFKRFADENARWINDFAMYKVLKRYHDGRAWYEWDEKYKNRDEGALEVFSEGHRDELEFERWIQWLLYEQFKDARAYAGSKGVLLNGDLPVLIARDSADVWVHPEFFNLEYAAGAPPDMYCAKGQRWGMPTYNWQNIASNGYRYLREKLEYAENFYDILRVDHVVGFFRIWSIPYDEPTENEGLNGFFDPRDENEWPRHGRSILSFMIDNTKMLLVGEDLGVIPRICPETLERLGIPGNDVQRWTKDWKVRHDFLEPSKYRLMSVSMLSTHDTTNWAAWWENEAGTIDERLFVRKCAERGIDYDNVKGKLFDAALSRHGRLRWSNSVNSPSLLIDILGKPEDEIRDFIDMYKNSYQEKERLWKHLGLKGPMREKCDAGISNAALKIALNARSIFCVQLMIDILNSAGLLKGDPCQYRVNTPGTISEKNWSLRIPISLEDLLRHKVSDRIRGLIASSGRRL